MRQAQGTCPHSRRQAQLVQRKSQLTAWFALPGEAFGQGSPCVMAPRGKHRRCSPAQNTSSRSKPWTPPLPGPANHQQRFPHKTAAAAASPRHHHCLDLQTIRRANHQQRFPRKTPAATAGLGHHHCLDLPRSTIIACPGQLRVSATANHQQLSQSPQRIGCHLRLARWQFVRGSPKACEPATGLTTVPRSACPKPRWGSTPAPAQSSPAATSAAAAAVGATSPPTPPSEAAAAACPHVFGSWCGTLKAPLIVWPIHRNP